jgi:hypothetical protein
MKMGSERVSDAAGAEDAAADCDADDETNGAPQAELTDEFGHATGSLQARGGISPCFAIFSLSPVDRVAFHVVAYARSPASGT